MGLVKPIKYWGGKEKMLKHLLPMIPNHKKYIEPFVGGGSLFWAKGESFLEVINDIKGEITNYYRTLKSPSAFSVLKERLLMTCASEHELNLASKILSEKNLLQDTGTPDPEWAWATYVFNAFSIFGVNFGLPKEPVRGGGNAISGVLKIEKITEAHCHRLKHTHITCRDATTFIPQADCEEAFFYCDPPYVNTNCTGYEGYTEENYDALLMELGRIKGKFLLSSFQTEILNRHTLKNGWRTKSIDLPLKSSFCSFEKEQKRKIEVLTYNYEPPQRTLFSTNGVSATKTEALAV